MLQRCGFRDERFQNLLQLRINSGIRPRVYARRIKICRPVTKEFVRLISSSICFSECLPLESLLDFIGVGPLQDHLFLKYQVLRLFSVYDQGDFAMKPPVRPIVEIIHLRAYPLFDIPQYEVDAVLFIGRSFVFFDRDHFSFACNCGKFDDLYGTVSYDNAFGSWRSSWSS